MRKSGRLASIHDEDDSSGDAKAPAEDTGNTKKFTPIIPAVRRKKVVEEDHQTVEPKTNGNHGNNWNNVNRTRKPLHTTAPANVSGPLSLGPASMPRSSPRSSASSSACSGGGILSARSLTRLNSSANGANSASKPLSDSFPIVEEFAGEVAQMDELLKPVVLVDSKTTTTTNDSTITDEFTHFEPESGKLFLFQMPPVLPTLLSHSSSASAEESAEKWPSAAQGRYGKLRRYKSGRLVMILENGVELVLNSSIESAAEAQNTCVLAVDPEFGQSFNLGSVQSKLVAVPEFEKFKTE